MIQNANLRPAAAGMGHTEKEQTCHLMTTTNRIPVTDTSGQQLAPCPPARARILLRRGRAVPHHRHNTFGIRLVDKTVPPDEIDQPVRTEDTPGNENAGFRHKPE